MRKPSSTACCGTVPHMHELSCGLLLLLGSLWHGAHISMTWTAAVLTAHTYFPLLFHSRIDAHLPAAFGVVRNPFDLDRSSAGSSGGPAAGASANFAMISLGSDTGNSIRGPSGHSGLVGIRSSIGQTSR